MRFFDRCLHRLAKVGRSPFLDAWSILCCCSCNVYHQHLIGTRGNWKIFLLQNIPSLLYRHSPLQQLVQIDCLRSLLQDLVVAIPLNHRMHVVRLRPPPCMLITLERIGSYLLPFSIFLPGPMRIIMISNTAADYPAFQLGRASIVNVVSEPCIISRLSCDQSG